MTICSAVTAWNSLPTLEMALAAWIASGGLVVLTDGTVSRRVSSVLVDECRLAAGGGWLAKGAVYLPMVDAYHLDGMAH